MYGYIKKIVQTRWASRSNEIQVLERGSRGQASDLRANIELVSVREQNLKEEHLGTRSDTIYIPEATLIQKIDEISKTVSELEERVGVGLSKLEEANIAVTHQINDIIRTVNKNNRAVRNSFRTMNQKLEEYHV